MFAHSSYKMEQNYEAWKSSASVAEKELAMRIGHAALTQMQAVPKFEPVIAPVRGKIGERVVFDAIVGRYPSVENVSKEAKSADMTLWHNNRKITIEVKNYSCAVPASQVEKFQRDLVTTNANGGVFISLNTPIATIAEKFTLRNELSGDRLVPTIYMCGDNPEMILGAIDMIVAAIGAMAISRNLYSGDNVRALVRSSMDHLDAMTRARNDVQTKVVDSLCVVNRTIGSLVAAETSLKSAMLEISAELYGDIVETSEGIIGACAEKVYVDKVVAEIEHLHNDTKWRIVGRRYLHLISGFIINVLKSRTEILVPQAKVAIMGWDKIGQLFAQFGKKIAIDDHLKIDIDGQTVGEIVGVICPL